ncbi:MAG: TlpA disulfide reductase family protein [Pirellulales bacterium]
MRRTIALLGLLVALGCSPAPTGPAGTSAGPSPTAPTQGDTPASEPAAPPASAPGVTLKILDGAGLDQLIASHRGKVVVVDAWSTSCEPCLKEFPNLVAMSQELGPERLACISLSLDFDGVGRPADKQAKVLKFLERFGAKFDNVLSSDEADAVLKRLEFYAPPAVFVYDQQGKLSHKFGIDGEFTYAEVRKRVDELLAKP